MQAGFHLRVIRWAVVTDARERLRRGIRESRRARTAALPAAEAPSPFTRPLAPLLAGADLVVGYAALPGEPDVDAALEAVPATGGRVLLPVTHRGEPLFFGPATPPLSALARRGPFRIREPEASWSATDLPDLPAWRSGRVVVLVPGLAFSPAGGRLGNGGGFYDRTFGPTGVVPLDREPTVTTLGVCWDEEVRDDVPLADWDLRVDRIVTEAGTRDL
ncbi:5-formyltetrahydrofolate cyclo-ligase [Brevibacterium litoralis]|uniref:5-formyltetrahydrofolate cyclo-ligase n=1 Tax=Brevibacterium litoralis TaxID=3138935 RepID=UPI0032EF69BC